MKIIIEYDNNKLKNISDELANLFINNNYETIILNDTIPINQKNNIIENQNNYFLISNKLNNTNNIDIIYPLKDNDKLAKALNDRLSNNIIVNKYYQLRSNIKTNLDYYEIFNNLKTNQGIIIKYGINTINNSVIPSIIFQTINSLMDNNIYIVKSGDSLYSIAKKYNTTVDELKRINNLTSNSLSIGQNLIIPMETNNSTDNSTYTVKSGDSLYSIAKKYNTTVDKIKTDNNLSSNLLSIGQKLIIKK